jgi:hypothetical protein
MPSSWLVRMCGRWQPRDSSVAFDISVAGRGEVSVAARDLDDGEVLEVSDLAWGDDWIAFTLLTPSTRWMVRNELRLDESGDLACTTTTRGRWERLA